MYSVNHLIIRGAIFKPLRYHKAYRSGHTGSMLHAEDWEADRDWENKQDSSF